MRPSRSRRSRNRRSRNRRTHRGGDPNNGAQGTAQANPFAGVPHPAGFPQFGVGPAGPAPPLPNLFAPPAVVAPAVQGFPQFGVQNPLQHPQNQQNVDMDDVMHNVAPNIVGGKRRARRTRRSRR